MSIVYPAQNLIIDRYKSLLKKKQADTSDTQLNVNKMVTSVNHNKAGDPDSYYALLENNQPLFRSKTHFINTMGKLSRHNRIHELFYVFNKKYTDPVLQNAYRKLDDLINDIRIKLAANSSIPRFEQLFIAYRVIESKYEIIENGIITSESFIKNLIDGNLDCNTVSFVLLALADELGWQDLTLINISQHAFIYFEGRYFDFGRETFFEEYRLYNPLPSGPEDQVLVPLDAKGLLSYFYFCLGSVNLYDFNDPDQAIRELSKAKTLNPNDYDIAYVMGLIYHHEKYSPLMAISYYKEALALNPAHHNIWYSLGLAYDYDKQWRKAIACYRKCINTSLLIDRKYINSLNNIGMAHLKMNNYKKAIRFFRFAVSKDPNCVDVWWNLAEAYTQDGKEQEKLECYQNIYRINGSLEAHFNTAFLLTIQGDSKTGKVKLARYKQALKIYREIVKKCPDYQDAWNNIGEILESLGMYNEAMSAYRKELECYPDKEYTKNSLKHLPEIMK
ncbi:tetratricopeptide repeat protein [Candidatus Margulisiibacteriota bacterium]